MVALEMVSVPLQVGMQSVGHPLTPSNVACKGGNGKQRQSFGEQ